MKNSENKKQIILCEALFYMGLVQNIDFQKWDYIPKISIDIRNEISFSEIMGGDSIEKQF